MSPSDVNPVNVKQYFADKVVIINENLTTLLPKPSNRLREAMRYAVLNGGKRFRPVLAIATSEMLDGDTQEVLPPACALEFIHCYSLVHDDLPCMDNDDLRRGRPTTHKQFDEATALLAGNALISLAFEVVSKSAQSSSLPKIQKINIIQELAVASGMNGMVGGQVADLESEGQPIDETRLAYIHSHKTGALIRAAVLMGAYASNATEEQIILLRSYAEKIGLLFQVTDDILDIEGNEAQRGKKIGGDLEHDKATYPKIHGMDRAKELVQELMQGCRDDLAIFSDRAKVLVALSDYVGNRKI